MPISVVYDLSRLVTRVLTSTPNGIDRVDWLLARHFLTHRHFETFALGLGFPGPRLLSNLNARRATERVADSWNEARSTNERAFAYEQIVLRLHERHKSAGNHHRIVQRRPKRALNVVRALARFGTHFGSAPRTRAPVDSLYLNATHFPLDWSRHVAWLDQRKDICPIFFVHDLLPIEQPQWFWATEPSRHVRRLDLLARRGAAALVASSYVEEALRRHLDQNGRRNLPIFRMALPVSSAFLKSPVPDPRLIGVPYFVTCGTIEPRKNHLLLLGVWRDLATQFGANTPKLIVLGKRGWNSEKIVAALEREVINGHVIEVAGLPTPDYKRLLDHCVALLAPSFAEGFGLPVAEALAARIPVIASDIAPFREQGGDRLTYLDPLSKQDWREAILASLSRFATQGSAANFPEQSGQESEAAYLAALDDFLTRL